MNIPLHNVIRPGIVHCMAFPEATSADAALSTIRRLAADPWFEVIELAPLPEGVHDQVREIVQAAGVEVMYGAQGRLLNNDLSLNHPDRAHREKAVAEVLAGVDEALQLGAHTVGILSGPDCPPEERPAACDRLAETLIELCARAEEKGVDIVLEVFDAEIEKKRLLGRARDVRAVAARVSEKQKNFGLLVDLSHVPLLFEDCQTSLEAAAPWLRHVHIGSCVLEPEDDPLYGDRHPRFSYPNGVNHVPEVTEFLEWLFRIGYLDAGGTTRRSVSFEVRPEPGVDPQLVIADARRTLTAAWAAARA